MWVLLALVVAVPGAFYGIRTLTASRPVPTPAQTAAPVTPATTPVPEEFKALGSLAFSKLLLERANVAVSPGVGFGEHGEGFVRIALVENRQRLRQATRNIKTFLAGRNDTADLRRAQRLQAAK